MEDLVAMIDHARTNEIFTAVWDRWLIWAVSQELCCQRHPLFAVSHTRTHFYTPLYKLYHFYSIRTVEYKIRDFLHPLPICDSFKNSFFHIYCIDNDEMKLSALTALLSMALVGGTVNATWASVIIAHRSHILTSYVPHVISETEVEPWPPLWQESQWQLEILPARLQFPLQQSLLASF